MDDPRLINVAVSRAIRRFVLVTKERDAVKDEILRVHDMPLLRLPTTGSGEQQRIRQALDAAEGVH